MATSRTDSSSLVVAAARRPRRNRIRQPPHATLVITVKSVTTGVDPERQGTEGREQGDRLLVRDRLAQRGRQFGKPAGAVVGRDEGVVVLTSATSGTFDGVTDAPRRHDPPPRRDPQQRRDLQHRRRHRQVTPSARHDRVGNGKSPLNTYHLKLGTPTSVTPVI